MKSTTVAQSKSAADNHINFERFIVFLLLVLGEQFFVFGSKFPVTVFLVSIKPLYSAPSEPSIFC